MRGSSLREYLNPWWRTAVPLTAADTSSDDELIHFGNKTYAFTNQWGGPRTFQAIENIIELLHASDIILTPMT